MEDACKINKLSLCSWFVALIVPLGYAYFYTPYGMDTTDFGYFYGYAWRILEGQIPYRDFYYIKPALPLYWHALWMWISPDSINILCGKLGFVVAMLITSWLASITLSKIFDFKAINLPLPMLATCGFVFGVHSFPHMPWHTIDGILFSSISLWSCISGFPIIAGIFAIAAMLCKQSFILVPFGLCLFLYCFKPIKLAWLKFALTCVILIISFYVLLHYCGAWEQFSRMTTGQLDIREAFDAGIGIYLHQNWWPLVLSIAIFIVISLFFKQYKDSFPPTSIYAFILLVWYIRDVLMTKSWIGYGLSWPTLFVLLGVICILFPKKFLIPVVKEQWKNLHFLNISVAFGVCLLISWSVAISGGYKIPAFFAVPLIFAFFMIHRFLGGSVIRLSYLSLIVGIVMFGVGYQFPYVFPVRDMPRSSLVFDAGDIYSKAKYVKVDNIMYEKLNELKQLREKYGTNYKTLPGFSFSYYLNNDNPIYSSDWLIDWEINAEVDILYNELLDKKIIVFMERDQMDAVKADNYDRAGYSVPQKVRNLWKIIDETKHFVVFCPPF